MKQVLFFAVLVACGGSEHPEAHLVGHNSSAGEALVAAVGVHDVAKIASFLNAPLSYGGLFFNDPGCATQFPTQAKLQAERIPAFAACLATLPLATSQRAHTLADIDVLQYEPGIEVELQFAVHDEHAWITFIGYSGRSSVRDALPTITGDELEKLRIEGSREIHPEASAAALLNASARAARMPYEYAWLKICLDADGAITGVHVREATSPLAERTFLEAAKSWRFRPFVVAGHSVPVCGMERITYPPTSDREVLPIASLYADGGPTQIAARAATRTAGQAMIPPDDRDKVALAKADVTQVVAAFKVCVAETGAIGTVTQLVPSGLPDYDAKLLAGIRRWQYQPILDGGKPVPFCTAVTFIYTQANHMPRGR